MFKFIFRILNLLFLLAVIFTASRALVRALPGDPLDTLIAESGTSVPAAVLRHELGLDQPFGIALQNDLQRFLHGDLGTSLLSKKPIAPLLAVRFAKTLELSLLTAILALAISLTLGLWAAASPLSWIDRACTLLGGISAALPLPWIGPILLLVFAVWIPIFPVGGHPLLPALALATHLAGLWARLIRERVRDVLALGAAPGARARGIPEWKILLKYGFAPASGSLAAYFGSQFGALLAGSFVVEVIFDWRGLGRLLIDAVLKRDYPIIEAATFIAAATSLLGTFWGDWIQERMNRRLGQREQP